MGTDGAATNAVRYVNADTLTSTVRAGLGGDGGGFCIIKGQKRLFVDTQADVETRYEHTLAAMAALPDIDTHFLLPEVREDIEDQRARG